MQRSKKENVIVPREKDRATYHKLPPKAKERRRKFGLDEDHFIEHVDAKLLQKFKGYVEEKYGRAFSDVLKEAVELKYGTDELAKLMYLFAKAVNSEDVDESAFLESYVRVSPYFTVEALTTIKSAVESDGKEPVVWRIDILCKR